MNFELFIARRLSSSKLNKNYYSGPIKIICILSIAISLIIMIIAISSGLGLKNAIEQKLINLESHIQISHINNSGESESIQLRDKHITNIHNIEGIKYVYPVSKKSAIISNNNNIEGVLLKGITAEYKTNMIKSSIIQGSYFNKEEHNQILISYKQANALKLKAGESCILYFLSKNNNIQKRKFMVYGIFKMENEMFDELYAFTKIETIQKINKWKSQEFTNYEITLDKNNRSEKIAQKINKILPYNLVAISIENKFFGVFSWIKLFNKNTSFILIIMMIICVINMTNALLILVLERTKMIGVLKSCGMTNTSILKIFTYNSLKMSLLGMMIGNTIGITLCLIQQKTQIIQLDSASYFVNYLPIFLDIKLLLTMNIITFAIIQISLIIPYYVMRKLSPSNILKIN